MFYIYYNDTVIASTSHPTYSILSGVITQAKNTADSFIFSMPATNPNRDVPQIRMGIVTVRNDSEIIFKGDVIGTRLNFDGSREIKCQGALAWLNDVCIPKISVQSSVSYTFGARLDRYNSLCAQKRRIIAGNCTNKPTSTVKIFTPDEFITVFEYFKRLIDSKGGVMLPRYVGDDIYLDYIDASNRTSKQEIRFGENLLDLENYISAESTITALYPTGKDGITIQSVEPSGYIFIKNDALYNKYGMIAQGAKYDSETPSELLSDATASLNALAVLNQTISLSALDLSMLDSTIDSINICDNVRAVSTPHGLDTTIECCGKTIDLLNPANSKITLGKTLKSLSKIIAIGGIKA